MSYASHDRKGGLTIMFAKSDAAKIFRILISGPVVLISAPVSVISVVNHQFLKGLILQAHLIGFFIAIWIIVEGLLASAEALAKPHDLKFIIRPVCFAFFGLGVLIVVSEKHTGQPFDRFTLAVWAVIAATWLGIEAAYLVGRLRTRFFCLL